MGAIAAIAGLLSIVFYIALIVGTIMLVVHGFKKDTTWGLINLLVPFGLVVFMFKFPDEAQPGRKITLIGLIGAIVCFGITILSASSM